MRADQVVITDTSETDAAAYAREQIAALGRELAKLGFVIEFTHEGTGLTVTNREAAAHLSEWIRTGRAAGEQAWYFWYSWKEKIAPIADVDAAAFALAHVLSIDETPGRG